MRISTLLLALAATAVAALAPGATQAQPVRSTSTSAVAGATSPATCVVHSLPSFVAQGEFALTATAADVIEVECDPNIYGTGSKIKITASQLYSRCNGRLTWYVPDTTPSQGFFKEAGRGVLVGLDADGNATVAVLAGPECSAGESLVTAHMEEEPFESFTTSFTVLPPVNTPPGVFALPASQVEDASSSAVATIIEAEVPGGSEKNVRIASEELYARCRRSPHVHWIRMDGSEAIESGSEVREVQLDNNGNAFVIAIGDSSCAEGSSLIEADLEAKPFTTFTTNFTVLPPQPTGEPAFTIEKRQEIAGSGSGFTSAPLKGLLGQTVDYQIVVTSTSNVAETFGELSDPHCDPGTIAGGPGAAPLAPGQSATYTCQHALTAVGTYTNEATATGSAVGGTPVTHTSNQVIVEVVSEPGFTIEKRQQLAGGASGFTSAKLTGAIGQSVEYEIVVKNTGNEALAFSNFADAHCDSHTIAGGPGAALVQPGGSTTYTCSHVLTSAGTYINEAGVTGAPAGEAPLAQSSNRVEVNVPGSAAPLSGSAPAANQKPVGGVLPVCEASRPLLRGASGPKRATFTVQISSLGIKRISFYLDGRKLKTLDQSQAKGGRFTITLDPRKLSYGAHKVSVKTRMSNASCAAIARAGVFVHPSTRVVVPKFTG